MVGTSLLAFHNTVRIIQNIIRFPLTSLNKLVKKTSFSAYWHALYFMLQLCLSNRAGKDWTILERLVCLVLIFSCLLRLRLYKYPHY
jgi:hypothetical protein